MKNKLTLILIILSLAMSLQYCSDQKASLDSSLLLSLTNSNSTNNANTKETSGGTASSPIVANVNKLDLSQLPEEMKPYVKEIAVGTHKIFIQEISIDKEKNKTEYVYNVTSGSKPAISHWVLGFAKECGTNNVISSSNDPLVTWTESDPRTGVRGIKFDSGYDDLELREVRVTLNGIFYPTKSYISIKAGLKVDYGYVAGPGCEKPVTELPKFDLKVITFLDINGNKTLDTDEILLDKVNVGLEDLGSNLLSQNLTNQNGEVLFTVSQGEYNLKFQTIEGLLLSSDTQKVSVKENTVVFQPYTFDMKFLIGKTANGYTIGFWKNNITKAIAGSTKGIQISSDVINSYLQSLSNFSLEPLNHKTLDEALATLSSNDSNEVSLLKKQLTASEFNFQNGAFINGNQAYTKYFLYIGEYYIKYSSNFTKEQIIGLKDLFDSYNNSHGGEIILN